MPELPTALFGGNTGVYSVGGVQEESLSDGRALAIQQMRLRSQQANAPQVQRRFGGAPPPPSPSYTPASQAKVFSQYRSSAGRARAEPPAPPAPAAAPAGRTPRAWEVTPKQPVRVAPPGRPPMSWEVAAEDAEDAEEAPAAPRQAAPRPPAAKPSASKAQWPPASDNEDTKITPELKLNPFLPPSYKPKQR